MSGSRSRPRWHQLPPAVRARIERLAGASVTAADTCPGGFSPGFASRLALADGRRVFVKAVDTVTWPGDGRLYRDEAAVTALLPPSVPAPRLLGTFDDGRWTALAFEDVDGARAPRLTDPDDVRRVLTAATGWCTSTCTSTTCCWPATG